MTHIERLDGAQERWRLSAPDACGEVVPSRGALIASFVTQGTEVLYLDQATLDDPTRNVRGGVPLLFPFAGKPPPGSRLPQHGFARRLPWAVAETHEGPDAASLTCVLRDSPETRASWPFGFEIRYTIGLSAGRLMLEWVFHNHSEEPMPLHFGIHPYFLVANKTKAHVLGATGNAYDNRQQRSVQVDGIDFSGSEVDLHFPSFRSRHTELSRGDARSVRVNWSDVFENLIVWTLPDQPFVCVEPWTALGGQAPNKFILPGQSERLHVDMVLLPSR
jgi:D-hexose-6-phosphate mutarotase